MNSTFVVRIPDPNRQNFPKPNGTGFFISGDGYFITANHVVENVNDFANIWLMKPENVPAVVIRGVTYIQSWPRFDITLLKATNFQNAIQFLDIDFQDYIEGTPVYAFGYPLPRVDMQQSQGVSVGFDYTSPRITSAVISSRYDVIGPVRTSGDSKNYVIDKALNYGNSGGPIVSVDSGKVIAVCVRFQPVDIPQLQGASIRIPSLYGVSSALSNIEEYLQENVFS